MRLSEAAVRGFAKHESFFPRYGWFRKAYAAAAEDPRIFTREDAPIRIGVGKNMVNAIRFWGLAAKLIDEDPQKAKLRSLNIRPTPLGHSLLGATGWDPYVEDPGTLWLLHWLMLAPPCLIPVWWIAFNDFSAVEFTVPTMEDAVFAGLEKGSDWKPPKASSVEKDISVLLRTYGSQSRRSQDLIYCPLRELSLIGSSSSNDRYRFKTGPKPTLPSEVVAYAALDYIRRTRTDGDNISIEHLAYRPGSPGRAFKLREAELAAALEPTVEHNRDISLVTRKGASQLVWWDAPEKIGEDVLDEYYYRIWHGPDVDIRQALDAAGHQIRDKPLAEILSAVDDPQPMVAARHSAQRDTLRVFARRYVASAEEVEVAGPFSSHDGEVLLVADADGSPPRVSQSGPAPKPVVAALPKDLSDLETAAREIYALSIALQNLTVQEDRVARLQLEERLMRARVVLENVLIASFGADSCRWTLLQGGGTEEVELAPGRGSAALSDAADFAYSDTPLLQNEMLNSNSLTSNGKRARKMLMEAMVKHGDREDLGFSGFGPEVAMYRACLKSTGLHRRGPDRTLGFRQPTEESWQPAWKLLVDQFERAVNERVNLKDVHAVLRSPPVGMKAGAVPVFIIAGLIVFRDEIAIYEYGVFRPSLTPDLPERMAHHPGHFTISSPPTAE